jgi:hypothetical protein
MMNDLVDGPAAQEALSRRPVNKIIHLAFAELSST